MDVPTFLWLLDTLKVAMFGPRTAGPMAPEIPLDKQRPARVVFSRHVEKKISEIRTGKSDTTEIAAAE